MPNKVYTGTLVQDGTPLNTNFGDAKPVLQIIDDDDDMRQLLITEFEDDYRVIDSDNGLTGFERAISAIPDVIISDVKMPGINGIKLCKILKDDLRTCRIPIVLITGDAADDIVLSGLSNGADDYVTKPFNVKILKARVANLVRSRKLIKRYVNEDEVLEVLTSANHSDDPFLKKAYEVIERNLANSEFEANDFAKAIGMSRAQIYRRVKAATGQSVKEFIRGIRLQKAAKLLISTDQNISEIAYAVGFSSAAYFSSSFSSYFKTSPSKYILLNKGRSSAN